MSQEVVVAELGQFAHSTKLAVVGRYEYLRHELEKQRRRLLLDSGFRRRFDDCSQEEAELTKNWKVRVVIGVENDVEVKIYCTGWRKYFIKLF